MRIVLITHYYPPEVNAPALRAYDNARLWAELGHDVTIVTAQPSHPYGKVYDGFRNETKIERDGKVRVVRLKTLTGPNAGFGRRIANYVSFMIAVWFGVRKIPPSDVVISTSPHIFCGFSGRFVAKRMNSPWILEVRDIWPDSIVAVGASKRGLLTAILSRWVRRAYHTADHIVSVSPGFADHFLQNDIPPQKVTVISNGVTSDMSPIGADPALFPELDSLAGRFIVSYFGTLGMAHGLSTIIEAADLLKDEDKIGFLIAGSGAERELLIQEVKNRGLTNVVMLGQQDRLAIRKLFHLSSANLVHLKKQEVFKTVIPTKLLEGMAMGKPILLGVEGVAKSILDEAMAGISFEPENPQKMAEAILGLAGEPDRAREFGRRGQKSISTNFNREKLAEAYLACLDKIQSQRAIDAKQ